MTSWSPPPRPAESQTHSVLKEGGKQLSVTQLVNFVCVCVCVCVLLGRCVTVLSSLNFLVALLLKSNFSLQLCHPTLTEGEKEGGREGEREREVTSCTKSSWANLGNLFAQFCILLYE